MRHVVRCLLLALCLDPVILAAQPAGTRPEDRQPTYLAAMEGAVMLRQKWQPAFAPARAGQQLLEGATVTTGAGATCTLNVGGAAVVQLTPGTVLTIGDSAENYPRVQRLSLEEGVVLTRVVHGNPFAVQTVNGSGRVTGTQFRTSFDSATRDSTWELLEGSIALTAVPTGRTTAMAAGQSLTLGPGGLAASAAPLPLADPAGTQLAFASAFGGGAGGAGAGGGAGALDPAKKGGPVMFLQRPPGGLGAPPRTNLPVGVMRPLGAALPSLPWKRAVASARPASSQPQSIGRGSRRGWSGASGAPVFGGGMGRRR